MLTSLHGLLGIWGSQREEVEIVILSTLQL